MDLKNKFENECNACNGMKKIQLANKETNCYLLVECPKCKGTGIIKKSAVDEMWEYVNNHIEMERGTSTSSFGRLKFLITAALAEEREKAKERLNA